MKIDRFAGSAKNSPYRQRIAAQASEPDETFRRRMAFSKNVFASTRKMRQADKGLILDLEKFGPAFTDFIERVAEYKDDPLIPDLAAQGRDAAACSKGWLDASLRHGFIFLPTSDELNAGSILFAAEANGVMNYILALHVNQSVNHSASGDMHDEPHVLLDAASYLNNSVYTINAYRFGKLEPIASLLFDSREDGTEQELSAIYLDRIRMVSAQPSAASERGIERLLKKLSISVEIEYMMHTSLRLGMARFQALSVRSVQENDEVEHTLRFLDAELKSSIIANACPYLFDGLDPQQATVAATLAGLAFGNTFDKMATIYSTAINGSNPAVARMIGPLIEELEHRPVRDVIKASLALMTSPERRLRDAAEAVLDNYLYHTLGKRLSQDTKDSLARIMGLSLIKPEHLPVIAAAWKEQFKSA